MDIYDQIQPSPVTPPDGQNRCGRRAGAWAWATAAAVVAWSSLAIGAAAAEPDRRLIVIIGGPKSHGPCEHDFPRGAPLLASLLRHSPDLPSDVQVVAYPQGWPDGAALEKTSTLVWYFDGLEGHPLLDPQRRAAFEKAMRRGVGLVALHQASTLPVDDAQVPLRSWLGAARYGMPDRTKQTARLEPAPHVVTRGLSPFSYRDEFYPTVRFAAKGVTPVLTAELSSVQGAATAQVRPVAWTYRSPHGRAFGFTGLHYLQGLQEPHVAKLLLNATFWTAGLEVPREGVRVPPNILQEPPDDCQAAAPTASSGSP